MRSAVICVLDRKQDELGAGWGSYAVILLVSSLGSLTITKFNGLNVHCFVVAHFSALYVYYSKTSNNGPSEKRTTSLQRTAHLPPIDFTTELIHYEPPRSGHLSTPNNGH